MKRPRCPKLPKGVYFIDERGVKLEKDDAWQQFQKTMRLNITVQGIPRQYICKIDEAPERVLYPHGWEVEENHFIRASDKTEESVKEFVVLAFRFVREERSKREKRAHFRNMHHYPETNRIASPTRFKANTAQIRLNLRDSIPRPR